MEQNTIIIIALLAIAISFVIGHAMGIKEGLQRGSDRVLRKFTRYTVATKRRAPDGSVYSMN